MMNETYYYDITLRYCCFPKCNKTHTHCIALWYSALGEPENKPPRCNRFNRCMKNRLIWVSKTSVVRYLRWHRKTCGKCQLTKCVNTNTRIEIDLIFKSYVTISIDLGENLRIKFEDFALSTRDFLTTNRIADLQRPVFDSGTRNTSSARTKFTHAASRHRSSRPRTRTSQLYFFFWTRLTSISRFESFTSASYKKKHTF